MCQAYYIQNNARLVDKLNNGKLFWQRLCYCIMSSSCGDNLYPPFDDCYHVNESKDWDLRSYKKGHLWLSNALVKYDGVVFCKGNHSSCLLKTETRSAEKRQTSSVFIILLKVQIKVFSKWWWWIKTTELKYDSSQ